MSTLSRHLRRLLDALYLGSGVLAAICLFALLLIIVAQMLSRALGISFPGAANYAGYMMAAASFFAFAYTLNRGGHVRVSLVLGRLKGRSLYVAELISHLLASIFCIALCWHATTMVYWSYILGDVSQGQDNSRLWIVQLPLALGSGILAVCFVDNLLSLLIRKQDNIVAETVD
ncbi:MAG TPA: TRAP transporter small permease [Burkholderiaceae bacterium]|nr:TRAP transporter small permease [Burkholderiaceae bacterium]